MPNIKISADSINITWTCNPAPGYATIYIKETGSSQNGVLYIVYPSGANFSKTISRLKAGTTYTIQIDAKGGDVQYRNENIVTTYAADKEVIWEQQENVHPSKEWTIKFSQKIDASTLTNQNISVTDANNNSVNIWLEVGSDGSSVIVKPREDYFSGQTYFLNINRNMRSETGQLLKNPVQMQFSIMP